MPKIEAKQVVVNEIKDKLDKAKGVVLVSARGLTVAQDTEMRKTLREAGVDYKVYKNTMINLAIKDTDFESLAELLEGPTAALISYDDATSGARAIDKYVASIEPLTYKGGVIEGNFYGADDMVKIAKIPSREELLSRLLGSMKSPISSFARVVKEIAKAGGAAATPAKEEAPAEAPAEEAAPVAEAVEAKVEETAAKVEETAAKAAEAVETVADAAEEAAEAVKPEE